eukprot:EG_transcript_4408
MSDPVMERFQAEIRELLEANQKLRDYVHRANFELQAYHEEFGVLQELRGSRGLLDPVLQDDPDPTLLTPLLVAYDRRIKCLEEELQRQLQVGIERGAQPLQEQLARREEELGRLRAENEALKAQMAREAEKALSLQGTYQDVLRATEAERDRFKGIQEENRVLREAQHEVAGAYDKLSDRIRLLEADAATAERNKSILQAALQAQQQKEAQLQRRLTELREDNDKLRLEMANLLKQMERERLQMQTLQQQEAATTASQKEALEELDNLRRENRRLLRDLDSGKQSIQGLQQSEFEILRKLKETLEQMEECKVDLSTGLVREGQKDAQLATLREQMRQLLAVQAETHSKHLKVVAAKHRTHVEELKEELRAKDLELSGLKAQLEKAQWERKQRERELDALKRDPVGGLSATAAAASGSYAAHAEDLHAKAQQGALERDELQRRLEAEQQRHRREAREWELQAEQLRHAAAEKDRKAAQLENACADLREEALQHQKEIDRLLKLSQALRMQKEEAERKADYELSACASRANLQEERLRLQVEEAVSRQRAAEQALEKFTEQRLERERQAKQDLHYERERLEQHAADCRAEVLDLEKRTRELSTQLAQTQSAAKERDREAETMALRSQQLSRSLEVHKEQLCRTTQKLSQLIEREASTRRDLKDCQLTLDRERLERERIEKDRDRYRAELLEVRSLLQSASASVHGPEGAWDDVFATAALDAGLGVRKARKSRRAPRPSSLSSAEALF